MNKTITFALFLAISFYAAAFSASGQEVVATPSNLAEVIIQQEEESFNELEMEGQGMLPTSPFYFLKEWRRNIRKFFSFNPVKKAELELKEISERLAEIKKMEEIAPQNINAINKAASNYQRNVERLKNRVEGLKETSQNPNINEFLDKLVEKSFQHQEFFDNLEKKFEINQELKDSIEASRGKINEIMAKIPEKFEDIDRFKERLENRIDAGQKRIFGELRAIEIIDGLKEKLSEEGQEKIQELKDELINKFENRIEKMKEAEQRMILTPEIREKIERVKDEVLDTIINCPQYAPIFPEAKDRCLKAEGELRVEKDKQGCLLPPRCVLPRLCIQIITPAVSPEGVCKEFSTPCDVPSGWQKVEKCPATTTPEAQ